jgi:hypothetical protein
LSIIVLLSSCKTHKLAQIPAAKAESSLQGLITALEKSENDYTWMRTRAHISYNGNSASATIKMRKDSLVWGAVNLFLELARGEITRDSAVLLNRTQKEYTSYPVASLQDVLAIPGLGLKSVQRLLMAVPPFPLNLKYSLEKRENEYKLSYFGPEYREEYLLEASTLRMKEYTFKKSETHKVRITYEDFEHVNNLILPKKINFEIESPEKSQISFEVTEYTLPATDEAPFSIPASYHKR